MQTNIVIYLVISLDGFILIMKKALPEGFAASVDHDKGEDACKDQEAHKNCSPGKNLNQPKTLIFNLATKIF